MIANAVFDQFWNPKCGAKVLRPNEPPTSVGNHCLLSWRLFRAAGNSGSWSRGSRFMTAFGGSGDVFGDSQREKRFGKYNYNATGKAIGVRHEFLDLNLLKFSNGLSADGINWCRWNQLVQKLEASTSRSVESYVNGIYTVNHAPECNWNKNGYSSCPKVTFLGSEHHPLSGFEQEYNGQHPSNRNVFRKCQHRFVAEGHAEVIAFADRNSMFGMFCWSKLFPCECDEWTRSTKYAPMQPYIEAEISWYWASPAPFFVDAFLVDQGKNNAWRATLPIWVVAHKHRTGRSIIL